MRISKIVLKEFRRFSDTTFCELPPSAKLILLAGPNGCGKSSLFDALNTWRRNRSGVGWVWEPTYHQKQSAAVSYGFPQAIDLEFHEPLPADQALRKSIYVRSAYRNDPSFQIASLQRAQEAINEPRLSRLIENDATVANNYQRLAAQGLEDVFENELGDTKISEFREKTIGELRDALNRLFPDINLSGLGNPLTVGTFMFDKGTSKRVSYMNLSGGEKAAFDLLLDFIVKKREFDDTVFCIDEPEAHMSTRLQGALLKELYDLLPERSQLWLATHSVGIMRRARDLAAQNPGEVVFLDFGGRDFDLPQVIRPTNPNRNFWLSVLNVALDDMAELVAPEEVVICEGSPLGTGARNTAIDAACYRVIFSEERPNTQFVSGGNASDVETDRLALVESIRALVKGVRVCRIIDRDDLSPEQVAEKRTQGLRVLSRRHIESYLYDDEVLTALCERYGQPEVVVDLLSDKRQAIADSIVRRNAPDDIKSAAGNIYTAAKRRLSLTGCGDSSKTFMRDTLAPLLNPTMAVYAELRADIFGA